LLSRQLDYRHAVVQDCTVVLYIVRMVDCVCPGGGQPVHGLNICIALITGSHLYCRCTPCTALLYALLAARMADSMYHGGCACICSMHRLAHCAARCALKALMTIVYCSITLHVVHRRALLV
jgi:hypothetical protein